MNAYFTLPHQMFTLPSWAMFWTEEHDIMLCREILTVNPFTGTKKGTVQRGAKWNEIVDNLMNIENPKFKVDQRAARDRYTLLSQKLRRKLREEEQASGIDADMTEVEDALEDIIDIEDNSVKQVEYEADVKMKEMDKEKQTAEDVRKRAMEKLGETQKRKGDVENERRSKKKRSNGSDTLAFLREKNMMESEMRKEKMEMKRRNMELQEKKHDDLMNLVIQQQQQQSKQMQDFQTMMLTMMARFGKN